MHLPLLPLQARHAQQPGLALVDQVRGGHLAAFTALGTSTSPPITGGRVS